MDEQLRQQLDRARAETAGGEVQAVFSLQRPGEHQPLLSPEQTVEITEGLLRRVAQTTGTPPGAYNIFKNLGAFAVSASPDFIENLLEQEEVASAVANRRAESALTSARGACVSGRPP